MIKRYKIIVRGKNPDYFIKKLIRYNINIYDLVKDKKNIYVVVDEEGLALIKKIKTSYKVEIINRYGKAKWEYLLRKYCLFFICLLIGIFINIFLSKIIFEVDVIHSNPYIREIVYNDLASYGIKKYNFKVSFSEKEKIVNNILERQKNDIEWLEIEEVGTKYVVKVEQRKKNKDNKMCERRNIVAKKDAMILEIEAQEGEIVKKKLDYVKKGDILISGVIHNKEEAVREKCATGKVYGEIWYKVFLEMPVKYREENVVGKVRRQLELQFLDKEYTLFSNFKTYQKESFTLVASNLLPIKLNFSSYLETKVIDKDYTLDNVLEDALPLAEKKLGEKLGEDSLILGKKVLKKYQKNSKIIIEVFFKVKEDITDYVEY